MKRTPPTPPGRNGEYLQTEEAWNLLKISKASFYRDYYEPLRAHSTTRRNAGGKYRYLKETVLAQLRPVPLAPDQSAPAAPIKSPKYPRARRGKGGAAAAKDTQLELPLD